MKTDIASGSAEPSDRPAAPEKADATVLPPPIEFGWILVGRPSAVWRTAVELARDATQQRLASTFPGFDWRLPLVLLPEVASGPKDQPVERLEQGYRERDAHAWDFALVVTPLDLHSHYGTQAMAVPSRALAVATISLARLAPEADLAPEQRARRLEPLVLHLFGDLNGLWHRDDPASPMCPPSFASKLDVTRDFGESERLELQHALEEVADARLEETLSNRLPLTFYPRAVVHRLAEIASAILQARPWEFPIRLARLTGAGVSALLILLFTAEAWDLATTQAPATIATVAATTLLAATAFLLVRQKLLLRRGRRDLSEQAVVTNVSATFIVLFGMISTWVVLAAVALTIGMGLVDAELLARWAPETVRSSLAWEPHLRMTGFVSSLGIAIGALGASFEREYYFRHVIYADEEI